MNLWIYELKKILFHKYILVLLAVLLISNIIACIFYVKKEDGSIPDRYMIQLMNMYKDDPTFIESEYIRLKTDYDRQIEAILHSIETTGKALPLAVQTNYIKYETYTDYSLFSAFFEYLDKRKNYSNEIAEFIEQAYHNQQNILDYGKDANSYSFKYQQQIIDRYSKLQKEIRINENYAYGWNILFSYKGTALFAFLSTLIIGCIIFPEERTQGFSPILNICKKGCKVTARHKIYAGIASIVILSLTFSLTSLASIGIIRGYSNPFDQIQILDNFMLCPYNFRIIDIFIIYQLLLILTNAVFILFIMLISTFTYKISITFIGGGVLLAGNYIIQNLNTSNQYKYINFFSATSLADIISRYRAVSLFNHSVNIHFTLFIVYIIISIALCIVIIKSSKLQRYISAGNLQILGLKKRNFSVDTPLNNRKTNRVNTAKSLLLLYWEAYKNTALMIIAVCVVIIKLLWSLYIYAPAESSKDEIYKEYMTRLEGELSNEKLNYIESEINYVTSICDMSDEMINKYLQNIITVDEYKEYLNKYKYSYSRVDLIKEIKERADYLFSLRTVKNINGAFIYDTGILQLLNRSIDYLLYFLLLFLAGSIFVNEYRQSSNMINIIRTTKKGRQKFYHAKFLYVLIVSMCVFIIFHIIDFSVIGKYYDIPNLKVPIISLPPYSQFPSNISIINYIICTEAFMFAALTLLVTLYASLSQILKKPIFIYSVCILITFAPHILSNYGVSIIKFLDFTVLMTLATVFPAYYPEMIIDKYNSIIIMVITLIITIVTYHQAHKQFCR